MWWRSWRVKRRDDRQKALYLGSLVGGRAGFDDVNKKAAFVGFVSTAGTRKNENDMAKREPTSMAMTTRVLFVCMGNICRSPMAEGVFRHMVRQAGLDDVVTVDSAGTHAFHAGDIPDKRAQASAAKRGYDLSELKARRVVESDFDDFDMVLAMDWDNLALLQQMAPKKLHHKVQLLMRFATEHESATIPDPYYGNTAGFETTMDYIEDACNGLMEVVRRRATQVAAA
jgi:protein-tyrosine phosphatase